jgi:hypothetical protein
MVSTALVSYVIIYVSQPRRGLLLAHVARVVSGLQLLIKTRLAILSMCNNLTDISEVR